MNTKRFEVGDVVTFRKAKIIAGANNVKSLLEMICHYKLIPEKLYIPIRSVKEYKNLPDEKNGLGVRYRKISICADSREHKLLAVYNIKPRFAHLANTYVRIK